MSWKLILLPMRVIKRTLWRYPTAWLNESLTRRAQHSAINAVAGSKQHSLQYGKLPPSCVKP